MRRAQFSYDPSALTVTITHPGELDPGRKFMLETADEVRMHFRNITAFWREHCGGKPVYWVVDYAGGTINPAVNDTFRECLAHMFQGPAITVLRYGGDLRQRSQGRMVSVKLHTPSHIYDSREEALEVVKQLREGTIKLGAA